VAIAILLGLVAINLCGCCTLSERESFQVGTWQENHPGVWNHEIPKWDT